MLNSAQTALYERLQAFDLDDPTHEFGFTRHLMKNSGWTQTYAQRAIAEYKKFAFLTVVADHQVVPSDAVDQVWHAHVLLTESYWEAFCPQVLGKKLHHHPARGGREERAEFHQLYGQTIASYRQFFGEPPTDIWSPPDRRFGAELKMQRLSLTEHWVIPKQWPTWPVQPMMKGVEKLGLRPRVAEAQTQFPNKSIALIAIVFGLVGCVDKGQENFLVSLLMGNQRYVIFMVAIVLGLLLRYVIRMPSKQPEKPELDSYQIAHLAGGDSRLLELIITKLVHQGYLRPNVRHRTFGVEKALPPESSPLEQLIVQKIHQTPEFKRLKQNFRLQRDLIQVYSDIRGQLQQQHLLMKGWPALIGESFFSFILINFCGVFVFGAQKIFIQVPIALNSLIIEGLMLLWSVIGLMTACCYVPSNRTRWGSFILADLRKTHDVYDVMQRFALYGYTALSGGVLDDLKQLFRAVEEDSRGSGGGCGC